MIFERIRKIIAEELAVEESKITMETDILEDLEADSLDVIDLIMTLEDEFGMEIPEDQVEKFRTVGDLVRYAEEST